jgi:cyclohexanecarboxylate-CoA ligase
VDGNVVDRDGRLLSSYVAEAAREYPDRIAVVDGATRLTYREFHDLILRGAAALAGLGIRPGEVVSWQLPNWWEALVVHHAILRAGLISNPLMPILREHELAFMLRQARSRALFVPEHFRGFDHTAMAERLSADLPDLAHVITVRPASLEANPFIEFLAGGHATEAPSEDQRSADQPCLLLYTSGTESAPKGALHSHTTLGYEDRSIIDVFGLTADDVVFMPSPLPHITGVLYGAHLATMLASRVVLQDVWDPARGLALIEQERCSFTIAATPFLHMLAEHPDLTHRDIRSLRVFGCGGADVSPTLVRRATDRLDACVVRIYGSTEFPTLSCGRLEDSLDRRAETDGRPIGRARVRCVNEDGVDVPDGEPGELLVRGPELFLGYLDRAVTATSMTADGWFRTGDLGIIDPDGSVVIKGRRKDIIVRGGENISVKEVEDLILESPEVREVAIVAMPDPVMVERMCAYVVPEPGCRPTVASIGDGLIQGGLMRQKLPERVELVDELPKTPSGKVKKFELRSRIARSLADEAALTPVRGS